MNPIEIAYFKHFMLDKSEHMKFLNLYRQRRFEKNPESIEKYFLQTSVEDVIMKAFAFKIKNIVGVRNRNTYDYWKEVDNAWQKYWPLMENNHSNERWWDLKATFAILRQNWDKHDFYLKENMESVEDTFKRLGAERPTPKVEPKFNAGDKIVNLNSGRVFEILTLAETGYITFDGDAIKYEFQDQFELVPEEDDSLDDYNGNEEDPLADFDFFDAPISTNTKFKDDEVSLNFNNKSWKITFNVVASNAIKNAGTQYARLAKNKQGDVCLILNKTEGVKLSRSTHSNQQKWNTTINSKDITSKIRTLLNIKYDYSILKIEQLSSPSDYIIYKLTKKQ